MPFMCSYLEAVPLEPIQTQHTRSLPWLPRGYSWLGWKRISPCPLAETAVPVTSSKLAFYLGQS